MGIPSRSPDACKLGDEFKHAYSLLFLEARTSAAAFVFSFPGLAILEANDEVTAWAEIATRLRNSCSATS